MAIKELFYDNRPQVLLDPRASQRIDPRFKFTRDSFATYVDDNGIIKIVEKNQPRFDYNPTTSEPLGLLVESSRTNLIQYSKELGTWTPTDCSIASNLSIAPDGTTTGDRLSVITADSVQGARSAELFGDGSSSYSGSIFVKKTQGAGVEFSIYFRASLGSGGVYGIFEFNTSLGPISTLSSYQKYKDFGDWWRLCTTAIELPSSNRFCIRLSNQPVGTHLDLWGAQVEIGPNSSSYIPTSGTAITRAADLLSVEAPLPSSGSVYIDARAITANENDTLLSLKNSSNDKIDLAYLSNTSTYDSLALIANYDGTSKTSLPLPVPTTARERNIITWGAQNYQYGRDSSRFATSLSSSVPTGLNQLSIGHDAVDPTKAFNGYINTVYAWSGELTPAVAEALVRNDLDPINADTYSPTGPAGALALVINTQGTASDGEKTFTLPAESAATDNDIVITWGDGTESGLDGADAEVGASGLTHTYPAAGIYPVWVEGQMENIYYNNIANAPDLLQIAAWGTGDMFTAPSTMRGAFYGCTQMDFSSSARTTNRPDTSAVTDWYRAFRDCESITGTFPAFNFSAATTFQEAWQGCSSMTAFVAAGDQTQNVTNFNSAWYNCSSLTAFPQINTSSGTNFSSAWQNCSSLTSFPLINTAAGTNFSSAWQNCSSLTSFPLINTAAGTSFGFAWQNCSSFTSFPLIDTSAGTNFFAAWQNCSSLTSFPLIDTSAGTSFFEAWRNCSSLTSFPLINTSAGTNFFAAWRNCSSLTSFPLINTSAGTNFFAAWRNCSSLTSFPLIDTSAGTNFFAAWQNCSSLTSFPLIDTSAGTNFGDAWRNCSSLTSFPLINTAAGTNFGSAWNGCSSLTDFAANFFDSWTGTPSDGCFYRTWDGCSSLTPASVVNILDSIAVSGQSAPSGTDTGDKEITIDWDGTGDPATTAAAAITTLKSRNWDVVLNGVSQ